MDWNIFFSSIAQAFASLLGVILAFIISRILNESIDYDNSEKETSILILEVEEIKRRVRQLNFVWHDRTIWKYDHRVKDLIRINRLENNDDDEIIEFVKRNISAIYDPESILTEIRQSITLEENIRNSSPGSSASQMAGISIPIPNDLWDTIERFEDDFTNLEIKAEIVIKKITNSKKNINRNIYDFSKLMKIIIAFLPIITFTIIYPLHFLPISVNELPEISFSIRNAINYLFSIRGLFICVLFAITIALILYFYIICKKGIKKYNALLTQYKREYSELRNYCKYFTEREI